MSASAGILLCTRRGRLLFCRRTQDGFWATPGGHIEPGERPRDAALRELWEETRIEHIYDVRVMMAAQRFTLFGASLPYSIEPVLDEEHDKHFWYPANQPPRPLHPGLRQLWHYDPRQRDQAMSARLVELVIHSRRAFRSLKLPF